MSEGYLSAPGTSIQANALRVPRAQDVVHVLQQVVPPYVRLIEIKRCEEPSGGDVVIVEVEVERPQRPVHDIRRYERIAIIFWDDDRIMPEVLALRIDFPSVPHLNLREAEFPRSLCLYEEPWRDLKRRWTPRAYVERIREWLARTAAGALHAPNQPLEPLLMGSPIPLVLPEGILDQSGTDTPEALIIRKVDGHGYLVLVAARAEDIRATPGERPYIATVVRGTSQPHGVIRRLPRTLRELHMLMTEAGDDLLAVLRERLKHWHGQGEALDGPLVLIVVLPKTRILGGIPESSDTRAFLCHLADEHLSVKQVGVEIGQWDLTDGQIGLLLKPDLTKEGNDVGLLPLNPVQAFSRSLAARLNGLPERTNTQVIAVGLGALGSQVFINMMRAGWGEWTLIDEDAVLPHNLARHAVHGPFVGWPKAETLAVLANSTVGGDPIAGCIVADVLEPGEAMEQVNDALHKADIILDMSASVTVARYLACEAESPARRISLFLNPTGTDMVLLAEDTIRRMSLDVVEMQYYRHIINDPAFADHLRREDGRVRYGHTCRDRSAEIPQDLVAMHAAIGSRALKAMAVDGRAQIAVWRTDVRNLGVRCTEVAPTLMVEQRLGEWRLLADERLLEKVTRLRHERLPNETGGVLVGAFDVERKIAYVVEALPSPTDSREWPTAYIRGSRGLAQRVKEISTLTDGMLEYVGEWHTHPAGHSPRPSRDDRKAFAWLAEQRTLDGLPPLMLIVGDGDTFGWYLGHMSLEDTSGRDA